MADAFTAELFMRYRLRTLLIVLAIAPPVLAGAWWYFQQTPAWVVALAFIAAIPAVLMEVLFAAFVYGFGALCHLIGRLPGGHDGEDSN